jgi:hypothetical protein
MKPGQKATDRRKAIGRVDRAPEAGSFLAGGRRIFGSRQRCRLVRSRIGFARGCGLRRGCGQRIAQLLQRLGGDIARSNPRVAVGSRRVGLDALADPPNHGGRFGRVAGRRRLQPTQEIQQLDRLSGGCCLADGRIGGIAAACDRAERRIFGQ